MDYNNNAGSNNLYPRIFYALYIGSNDNSTGHLIFKLSTKQILTTMKYKLVPVSEDLIQVINEMNSFTTKIQINHFNSDHFTAQDDHFDNTKDNGQAQCDAVGNSEDESYDEIDSSQKLYGMQSNRISHQDIKILLTMKSSKFTSVSVIKPTGITFTSMF